MDGKLKAWSKQEGELTSLDCERVFSVCLFPVSIGILSCVSTATDTNCTGKRKKGEGARCTFPILKDWLPGRRRSMMGMMWRELLRGKSRCLMWKPADRGKTLPSPSPLPLLLFIHPPYCLSDAAEEKPHPFHHARPHTEKPSASRFVPLRLPLPECRHAPLKYW